MEEHQSKRSFGSNFKKRDSVPQLCSNVTHPPNYSQAKLGRKEVGRISEPGSESTSSYHTCSDLSEQEYVLLPLAMIYKYCVSMETSCMHKTRVGPQRLAHCSHIIQQQTPTNTKAMCVEQHPSNSLKNRLKFH